MTAVAEQLIADRHRRGAHRYIISETRNSGFNLISGEHLSKHRRLDDTGVDRLKQVFQIFFLLRDSIFRCKSGNQLDTVRSVLITY